MKKLLSINIGSRGFRREYDEACQSLDIPADAIRARNCCFIIKNGTVTLLNQNVPISPDGYNYAFIRLTGKFALMTSLICQFLDAHQIELSDPIYLQHASNKEKVSQMLQCTLAGLPIPNSILFPIKGFYENAAAIYAETEFPCVLKTNGSQGRNVWKISSREELEAKLPTLKTEMAMLQEFVPNSFDIRAIYMHGDIIGAIKRSSADGFLNNVSAGGAAEPITLTPEEIELAKQGCALFDLSFAGVDIVRTPLGPLLFEINIGPQIYGFEAATKINVPLELLRRFKARQQQ